MTFYRQNDTLVIRFRSYGLTFGRYFLRPSRERWADMRGEAWHVQALGVCFWRDTFPAITVGERGAW